MRKYVIGFLVGLLAASAFPVYGAVNSLIGREIQIEYPVIVNGERIATKAISIDGVSYSPNRAVADALGLEIGFENKTVIFNNAIEEKVVPVVEPVVEPSIKAEIGELEKQIAVLKEQWVLIVGLAGGRPLSPEDQKKVDEINVQKQIIQDQIKELQAQVTPTP